MSPPSPAGRGSVGPAGMGACSRRCSPPPKMPLHLPGPPQTKLQDFARHPRLSPAVPWVLFPPVPVRCRPLPPYGHAGFRPWAPPPRPALSWGRGGVGGTGVPLFPPGTAFLASSHVAGFCSGVFPRGISLAGRRSGTVWPSPPATPRFPTSQATAPRSSGLLGVRGRQHPCPIWHVCFAGSAKPQSVRTTYLAAPSDPPPRSFGLSPDFLVAGKQASNTQEGLREGLLPCRRFYMLSLFGS